MALLSYLYGRPDESFYLRQLARSSGAGLGAVQRELTILAEAGVIQRRQTGRQVFFQANPECPIFSELRGIVTKTFGVVDILRVALGPLTAQVQVAFLYGSVARGEISRGSDIDVMVIGDASFGDVVTALAEAQKAIGREVNPTVFPPAEFRNKLGKNNHFLDDVMGGSKIFIVGTERDLAGLAQ